MPRSFRGKIKLDVRDSKPDWGAFLDNQAPKNAPNVLVILYDDTGQAAWSTYGGRIDMPTLDRLAKNGLKAVASGDFRTQTGHYALCGEGLCVGRDSGDAVSKEYQPQFPFADGEVIRVIYDIADDAYDDVERKFAAKLARD